jgi:hypothetical protein
MIKFKVVNKIPRIMFRYKSISTNKQLAYLWFYLPTRPATILNFLRIIFFGDPNIYRDELGILLSHDDIYKENDIILAIGIGSGISLIHNCKKERGPESFIGIDGSKDQIEIAKDNARLNGVDLSKFKLIEGYVGNPTNIYGSENQKTTKLIEINHMDFDILELDCEGSEVEILKDLTARPRHIIVEMHPNLRDLDFNSLVSHVCNTLGYSIASIYNVGGKSISLNSYQYYFSDIVRKDFRLLNDINYIIDHYLVFNFQRD